MGADRKWSLAHGHQGSSSAGISVRCVAMKYRTTTWDVLKFAWVIWRSPHRANMRIGQLIDGAMAFHSYTPRLFYVENKQLRWLIVHFWW